MNRLKLLATFLFAVLLLSFSGNLFAITDEEVFRNFQFSFVNPGARSTGLGGAFIGLADDATAAEANPAGLTILTKPEVSFEYRGTRFDPDKLNSINAGSSSEGEFRAASANELDDLNQPSFLSVVFPSKNTTYGFSRQESVRQKGNINEGFELSTPTISGAFVSLADVDQTVVNWNFSFASKLSDGFSVGASLRYCQLDWTNTVQNFAVTSLGTIEVYDTNIDDTDNAFAFNIGFMSKLGKYASWGAVYKRNPKFEVQETTKVNPNPLIAALFPLAPSFTNELKIPDTFGTGIAVKPNDNFTLVADVVYIKYSDLEDGFQARYNILTFPARAGSITYKVDNKFEFHAGTEFVVLVKSTPLALREGYYRKPSNSLLVDHTDSGDQAFYNSIFTKRDDENHFTLGMGVVFGPNFQMDWAADLAKSVNSYSFSTVVRF